MVKFLKSHDRAHIVTKSYVFSEGMMTAPKGRNFSCGPDPSAEIDAHPSNKDNKHSERILSNKASIVTNLLKV